MNITFDSKGNTLIARIGGELDMSVTEGMRIRIDKEFDRQKAKNLILDLRVTEFIDSSGLGMILGRFKKVSAQEGRIGILANNISIIKILELSGIFKLIPQYSTESDALRLFQFQIKPEGKVVES